MSLSIDISTIGSVLLLAGGWHEVSEGSFELDSYEFMDGETCVHGGGHSNVCATGFGFTNQNGLRVSGPLTAVLAVKTAEPC